MLLERVLSKLSSFAAYSDTPKPNGTSVLEEDSDTSVFSDDEEYEEVTLRPAHNSSQVMSTVSHASKGKKRARASEEPAQSDGDASESPSKRVKLEIDTAAVDSTSRFRPAKKEVRFHPDTLDNWRWADRDMYTLRANLLSPLAASSPPSGPDPLPSIAPSMIQPPLVATPNPKPLSSTNLSAFLESDRDISGHLGVDLPSSGEGTSYRNGPEYDSICAVHGGGSPIPSLCGEIDPPSRSPSPDSRRQAWGSIQDGVWDDFEEEELLDMTLKGAPTPLSSPTLPSHPIGSSTPSPLTNHSVPSRDSIQHISTPSSKPLSSSEVASLMSQIRRLDRATQALAEKYAHHRSQEGWRAGFQVGIHTQLTATALAAAAQEEGRAKLLGLPTSKTGDAGACTQAVSGPSQSDLSSVDKKILQSSKKREKKKCRWTVIGKEEMLRNQRGWAAIDAAKFARVRTRGHGIPPATVPATKAVAKLPIVQGQLSDLEGDFEEEKPPLPTMSRPKQRLPL